MKPLVELWRFVVTVALRWYHESVGDLAAGVTFWILISLPASTLALLAALRPIERLVSFGFQAQIEEEVLQFTSRVLATKAGGLQDAIASLFRQDPNSGLLVVSLGIALWSISRGFAGLMRALDDIYGIEHGRPWYHARVVAILLGTGTLLIIIPLLVVEQVIWDPMRNGPFETVGRVVLALLVLTAWASMLLHFGPSNRGYWRDDLPGAVTAAVLWLALSSAYGWYVSLTSSSNDLTAAVGAGLLALTWLWMSAQVLLIGGAVNYVFGQNRDIRRDRRSILSDVITGEFRKVVSSSDEPAPEVPDRPDRSRLGAGP